MNQRRPAAIAELIRQGDPDGYRALLDTYGRRLYGYFLRSTANHHDAEDMLGDLALRVIRRISKYRESGRFEQWLFRIAANMVRDRIRRSRSGLRRVSISDGEDKTGWDDITAEGQDAADDRIGRAETSSRINEALNELDEATKQMILLRYYGEMSFRELADIFDCPIGTALARVHRGLESMRNLLNENES